MGPESKSIDPGPAENATLPEGTALEKPKPVRAKPPVRSEGAKQISISLHNSELQIIEKNAHSLKISRSEYLRLMATDPGVLQNRLAENQNKSLPQTLHWATAELHALKSVMNGRADEILARPDYSIRPYFNYTVHSGDPGTRGLQKAIVDTVSSLPHLIRPGREEISPDSPEFDVTTQLTLFSRARVLLPFPVWLTEIRRPFIGLIQYAVHRRIGIYFHKPAKDSPIFAWRALQSNERNMSLGTTKQQSKVHAWFSDFLRYFYDRRQTNSIWAQEAFFYQEFLQLLFTDNAPPDLLPKFGEFVRELHMIKKGKQLHTTFHDQSSDGDALFFDLTQRSAFSRDMEKDIIELTHGVDIRIGVGFSLFMLPAILHENNWQHILSAAQRVLRQPAYKAALGKSGIDLI